MALGLITVELFGGPLDGLEARVANTANAVVIPYRASDLVINPSSKTPIRWLRTATYFRDPRKADRYCFGAAVS